ncbi:MAG: DUF5700 domain-containing putative Zn-dependent protease [bacterium]
MRQLHAALFCSFTALAGPLAGAQAPTAKEPPYPKTGIDFSGVDQFYKIADILAKDVEPSEAQWRALLATPGYRIVLIENDEMRALIDLALKPSRKPKRDSVFKTDGDGARVLNHLITAAHNRADVLKTCAILERSLRDSIAAAVPRTTRYLPKGTIERFPTPLIAFAVFADDGFAEEPGILLDPLYVQENGIVELLSHELHHSYTGMIHHVKRRSAFEGQPRPADLDLFFAVMHLRNEGIADQVDKPYPLPSNPKMTWYATGYNAAYAKTPAVLHTLDSLLAVAAEHPAQVGAAGAQANRILWSNGHPNGAYMARTIVQTFGIDSLMPGVYSPIAFFRTFAAAEVQRGNPPPFSAKAMSELAVLEKGYITQP